MNSEIFARGSGTGLRGTKVALSVLACALVLTGTACGGGDATGAPDEPERRQSSEKGAAGSAASSGTSGTGETSAGGDDLSGEAAELARAEVGEREISNMLPAGGKKPDPPRPLPEDPPDGIEVYPATTNRTVKGAIEYDRQAADQR